MKTQYPIVNENDEVIGEMGKREAYKAKQMLRSSVIFVFNSGGELFLQKRAKDKDRYPGAYCMSAAGHVEPNETYEQAAKRELFEELGLKAELVEISQERVPVGPGEFAMSAVFTCVSDDEIALQEEEVESGEFHKIDDVLEMIRAGNSFTPNIVYLLQKYGDKLVVRRG